VLIPNIAGDGTDAVKVLSIQLSEDENGNAIWDHQLNERWRAPEQEVVGLLRSIGGKSTGATPPDGAIVRD
jgi:hypothetical protein